jgi:hypothetical protein
LVVGDDLDSLVRPDTDTRVGRTLRMSAVMTGGKWTMGKREGTAGPPVATHQVNTDSLNHVGCVYACRVVEVVVLVEVVESSKIKGMRRGRGILCSSGMEHDGMFERPTQTSLWILSAPPT